MKKTAIFFILFLNLGCLCRCTPPVQHADPFYNVPDSFSMARIPLIKPLEANRLDSSSPWSLFVDYALGVAIPGTQEVYLYNIEALEKFAVTDGIILAYSPYVNTRAAAYIQENYYHWFVIIPAEETAQGFQTEDEFRAYIQTLGIAEPDWQAPDAAWEQFRKTGCLAWLPDCGQAGPGDRDRQRR
ncbi:MAG TPA: hypothetical protein PKG95_10400 [Anaerolineaceae bacterium]|jgi:hypothetical protein|nr:hypothetical protein [Anaerolineaceae bacterium]